MLAYAAGDYSAFETLYQKHSGKVYAYLRRKLSSSEEVDEVFQKVFMKVHQARRKYRPEYLFAQWLFVIAKTSTLDHFRKQKRQVQTDDIAQFGDIFEAEVSQNHGGVALKGEKELTILEDLPSDQRAAVEKRILEDLSYEEIARQLQKTESNVRKLVSRALKKLRGSDDL